MEEIKKTWIDEMIERQAIPEELREETNGAFCEQRGIPESTYYYHAAKSENQEKIIKIALSNAKKYAPEVLENLGVRAKSDNKAAEMYLKFVLQLAEKIESKHELSDNLLDLIKNAADNKTGSGEIPPESKE